MFSVKVLLSGKSFQVSFMIWGYSSGTALFSSRPRRCRDCRLLAPPSAFDPIAVRQTPAPKPDPAARLYGPSAQGCVDLFGKDIAAIEEASCSRHEIESLR